MGVIRWTGKAFQVVGGIMTADAFEEWVTDAGKAQLEKLAKEQTFSLLLGRTRAKRKLRSGYASTFSSETLMAALDDALSEYRGLLAATASRCSRVQLLRATELSDDLVVVPREPARLTLVQHLIAKLRHSAELAEATTLREIVLTRTAEEAEQELFDAASKSSPLIYGTLVFVGTDATYTWPGWTPGHYYALDPGSYHMPEPKDVKSRDYKKKASEQVLRKQNELGRINRQGKAEAVAALNAVL